MRYIFLFLLWLSFFNLSAQTGNYFLSHYAPSKDRFDNVCFDMVQDARGMMYFATRNGVLEFDGRTWELISGRGAVYSLQLAPDNVLYWSGTAGYGKIDIGSPGLRVPKTLSKDGVKDIFQSIFLNRKIYFAAEQFIYIEQGDHPVITLQSSNLTGAFISMFELFGSVYVNTERGGIFKVEGDKLVRSTRGLPEDEEVIFSAGYGNFYLLGLANGNVFLCGEDLRPRLVHLEDSTYADASVIVNGSWVNRDLFVLGTLRGGLIFVQAATGKTQEIVNYSTGLPDNEVYALMSDQNQCVWAAHEYGFTRVAPYLPFRSFSHYNGLTGNLLCALSIKGHVYVGTSLGLFKLEREDVYDEITYFVDVPVKETRRPAPAAKQPISTPPADTQEAPASDQVSKKKGFLWFRKRNRAAKEPDAKPTTDTPKEQPAQTAQDYAAAAAPATTTYRREQRIERVLRTSQYVYKKVQGINAKVTHLLEYGGRLIAAGLAGAFEVKDLQAVSVLEEPVRAAYGSYAHNMLLLATYADEVHAFRAAPQGWQPLNLLANLDDRIDAMVDGPGSELWLCALDKAYRLQIDGAALKNIQTIPIENPTFEAVACIRWHNDILLTQGNGFLRFDRKQNAFEVVDSLPHPTLYFSDGENILFNDSRTWSLLGKDEGQTNLQLLNLLQDPRFAAIDQDAENLWVITGNNELYKFFGEKFTPYQAGFSPVLKGVRNGDTKIAPPNLELEETHSSLSFNVVQPEYLTPLSIEYRHQLKGLEKEWSEWAAVNNQVDFPYLPAGDYTLLVQSRDIFGRVRDLPSVSFEVLPPYWKRPWFYALEFFVFAGCVLLSFRLSNRYRIISRLLSLLTIIMLIQLIQTVVTDMFETKASPVTDFFVQVLIAFMILPVEGYLRSLMLRSLDTKSGLYRFLTPRSADVAGDEKEEP